MITIESLKKDKIRYNIEHFRWSKSGPVLMPLRYFRAIGAQADIAPNGGLTMVSLRKNGQSYSAIAECSEHDSFQNKVGINIALQRIGVKMAKDAAKEVTSQIKD